MLVRVKELEEHIRKQDMLIVNLEAENIDFKKKIERLENIYIEKKYTTLNRFVTAIQDVNSLERMENIVC